MWTRSCLATLLLSLNALAQMEQAYGFSPVWVRSCLVVGFFWFFLGAWACVLNFFAHIEQGYGFSPVWVRSWMATLLFSLKRLAHIEQAYGFSPVWVRSCLV